ncbi:hypothetical protein BN996_00486 [Haloferax massiliensis]|uniref:Uncharacterized protein n=1 Tax=Haloferax massiliensis TaxID=1476858 RepID=A0A0D6JMB4_9EURY|nr:hypothetical protein BN996_00486 [Haloferax massiliensis]
MNKEKSHLWMLNKTNDFFESSTVCSLAGLSYINNWV